MILPNLDFNRGPDADARFVHVPVVLQSVFGAAFLAVFPTPPRLL
jgi:hypothetical protein